MLNDCRFIGRLTKDIEVRSSETGKRFSQFTIAVDRGKDRNGNKLGADFISCVAWEQRAETLKTYCRQGDAIMIAGRLNVNKRGDNYYHNIVVNEIEFLPSNKRLEEQPAPQQPVPDLSADEDLPF